MRRILLVNGPWLLACAAVLGVACGGDGEGPSTPVPPGPTTPPGTGTTPGTGAGTGTSVSPASNFQCCLNGAFYRCPDQGAFDRCAGFDVGACMQACSPADFGCLEACNTKASTATHDPSSCERKSGQDGECKTGGTGGLCVGHTNGMKCTYGHQCPSGYHCTKGKCYANELRNPCEYSHQCSSNKCVQGCCTATSKGTPCDYSHQCDSSNCTGGRCQ